MSEAPTSKWDSHLYMTARGAVGGLFAGLIFGAFQMWYVADSGLPADTIMHMIATIIQPDANFAAGTTSLAVGWFVHIGLSITYGALLGLLASEFRSNGLRVALTGLFGLAIYMFNFLLLVPLFYPVFETANQPFEAVAHIVYGFLLAPFLVTWHRAPKESEQLPAIVAQAAANASLPAPQSASYNQAHMR